MSTEGIPIPRQANQREMPSARQGVTCNGNPHSTAWLPRGNPHWSCSHDPAHFHPSMGHDTTRLTWANRLMMEGCGLWPWSYENKSIICQMLMWQYVALRTSIPNNIVQLNETPLYQISSGIKLVLVTCLAARPSKISFDARAVSCN